VVGDGRLELARQPERAFDVIVLDAFSSDSVPVHLLTREALGVYLRKLAPGGVIAFHISNRYLDLAPVIGGVTRSLGLTGRLQAHDVSRAAAEAGAASSIWAVVTRDRSSLGSLAGDRRWETLPPGRVWSDQSSDILGTIRWFS
jgi:spermidine synthase